MIQRVTWDGRRGGKCRLLDDELGRRLVHVAVRHVGAQLQRLAQRALRAEVQQVRDGARLTTYTRLTSAPHLALYFLRDTDPPWKVNACVLLLTSIKVRCSYVQKRYEHISHPFWQYDIFGDCDSTDVMRAAWPQHIHRKKIKVRANNRRGSPFKSDCLYRY